MNRVSLLLFCFICFGCSLGFNFHLDNRKANATVVGRKFAPLLNSIFLVYFCRFPLPPNFNVVWFRTSPCSRAFSGQKFAPPWLQFGQHWNWGQGGNEQGPFVSLQAFASFVSFLRVVRTIVQQPLPNKTENVFGFSCHFLRSVSDFIFYFFALYLRLNVVSCHVRAMFFLLRFRVPFMVEFSPVSTLDTRCRCISWSADCFCWALEAGSPLSLWKTSRTNNHSFIS